MKLSLSLLFSLIFLSLSAQAEISVDAVEVYTEARSAFERAEFELAVQGMELAVSEAPSNPVFYLWLGRSYGRLAEQSPWFKALGLAKKTVRAFEKAVELRPDYPDALEDLIAYYREAPGIVGGSEEKAEQLQKRLDSLLLSNNTLSALDQNRHK